MTVRIAFDYEPEEPDDSHSFGMSESEHDDVVSRLMQEFGADDISIKPERGI